MKKEVEIGDEEEDFENDEELFDKKDAKAWWGRLSQRYFFKL